MLQDVALFTINRQMAGHYVHGTHSLFYDDYYADIYLKGHFTHVKLFFKITEIETLINITYIVRFLRSTDVSAFYY